LEPTKKDSPLKTFNVVWEEKHSVNIDAESEEDAIQKVLDCDYDDTQTSAEVSAVPEAFEIDC